MTTEQLIDEVIDLVKCGSMDTKIGMLLVARLRELLEQEQV